MVQVKISKITKVILLNASRGLEVNIQQAFIQTLRGIVLDTVLDRRRHI